MNMPNAYSAVFSVGSRAIAIGSTPPVLASCEGFRVSDERRGDRYLSDRHQFERL